MLINVQAKGTPAFKSRRGRARLWFLCPSRLLGNPTRILTLAVLLWALDPCPSEGVLFAWAYPTQDWTSASEPDLPMTAPKKALVGALGFPEVFDGQRFALQMGCLLRTRGLPHSQGDLAPVTWDSLCKCSVEALASLSQPPNLLFSSLFCCHSPLSSSSLLLVRGTISPLSAERCVCK